MLNLFCIGTCSLFCVRYTIMSNFKYPATGSFILPNCIIFKKILIDKYFEALEHSKPGSLISFESECSIADQRRFFHWELTPLSLAKYDQRHVHILIGSDTTDARTSFENWLGLLVWLWFAFAFSNWSKIKFCCRSLAKRSACSLRANLLDRGRGTSAAS